MIIISGEQDPDSKSSMLFDDVDASTNTYRSAEIPTHLLENAVDDSVLGHCSVSGEGLASSASITRDGRINVELDLKAKVLDLPRIAEDSGEDYTARKFSPSEFSRMNIVIMIVGSRGDVQPYVALGRRLSADGHRVRLATHETFRSFVCENGLEFFDIGGNPQDLMSYMVKNPGLMPGIDSLTNGDIKRKRQMLSEMIKGCWDSCYSPCPITGKAFVADAIISNPPAFAHIHCAEAMKIPLLMSFTMPWSPTTSFPHPLVNINKSNADRGLTNFLTYHLAELLTWQGLGDIINKFRMETLGLLPLSIKSGPGILDSLQVPWTYCMSPALVPKPTDWLQHIDVTGFYFLDLATNYTPPPALAKFLEAGPPPIYIGFGSVVVDDPEAMTNTIFAATRQAGVRALVSAGWGGLGGNAVPPHIFILGNIPHDWLFAEGRVAAVVHHGGAGTISAGLSKGLPTVVVPFFGDQGFWGSMIEKAGAGPKPLKPRKLDVDGLKDAIIFVMSPSAKDAAQRMADQIRSENGVDRGASSFYRHLPLEDMKCSLVPSRTAAWWSEKYSLRLSSFAATTLAEAGQINMADLKLCATRTYDTHTEATNPVSGASGALFWTLTHYSAAVAEILYSPMSGLSRTAAIIPDGVVKVFNGVYEGFHNAPSLYGSEVRKSKKITGTTSGFKEGGKAFYYGLYDGITGLVTEPLRGAKENGAVGALTGSARSMVDLAMKPMAGTVALVSHPMQGAWTSVKLSAARKTADTRRKMRVQLGAEDVKASTSEERWMVIKGFNACITSHIQRQKAEKEKAKADKEDRERHKAEREAEMDRVKAERQRMKAQREAESRKGALGERKRKAEESEAHIGFSPAPVHSESALTLVSSTSQKAQPLASDRVLSAG
ncbi:glycosyltransferase family 1 protein [Hymenopellis radicata]|nr:glycosyltransferase family 1 protein [Hymenopellis radicata]